MLTLKLKKVSDKHLFISILLIRKKKNIANFYLLVNLLTKKKIFINNLLS